MFKLLRLRHITFASIMCTCLGLLSAQEVELAEKSWLDAKQEFDQRVEALLAEMTLEEKVGQLWQTNGLGGEPTGDADKLVADSQLYEYIRRGELGSILNEINVTTMNAMQRVAVEETRLGIPIIFGRDVIHGFRTVFPIPLGQAASWNPELVKQASAVAAREARSQGQHWTFAPMVDVARDARWGRIAESPGEDPLLCSALSRAMVEGFQGDDLASPESIAACAKHFAVYGAAEGGRDYNTVMVSTEQLHNTYLPSFKVAVDAGVATLMTSFNEVNGVPASANRYLLRDVLRERWGFKGFVVSDWTSVEEMIMHGYSADHRAAAEASALAGLNMEMVSENYHTELAQLVRDGVVQESIVDDLVREILDIKFRLGLFESPYTDTQRPSILLADEHLEIAQQLAIESVVLLKNENQTLPLQREKLKTIAVIGPLADDKRTQLGCWIPDGRAEDSRTPLAAIRETVGQGTKVEFVQALENDLDESDTKFGEAVAAAAEADVVLLFVGEHDNLSGEARSRAILDLPGAQSQLVEAIADTGKPVVMIVQAGRPLTIGEEFAQVDAVLYSWHAGTMAGPALADLLWGVESPSGKLPVTYPKAVGQLPLYYNHKNTGRPPQPYDFEKHQHYDEQYAFDLGYNSNYLDVEPYPLYPFGYGLSYATFEYGEVELSTTRLRDGQTLAVRVPVTNTSKVDATEVVQLYVRDVVGSVTRPVRELKDFRRVPLRAGEQTVVEFALAADDLKFFNNEAELILEPGTIEIFAGGSSLAPNVGEIEIVK